MKKYFIDSITPIQVDGQAGYLFRLLSETSFYVPAGYFFFPDKAEEGRRAMGGLRSGSWITAPDARRKRSLYENSERYRVFDFIADDLRADPRTNEEWSKKIGALEDGFEKIPEKPTFNFDGGKDLRIAVLKVGQGDLILVRFPSNEGIVIDANYCARIRSNVHEAISEFFEGRSPKALVLTHKHMDHVRYATELIKRFKIPECWWPICSEHRHASAPVEKILQDIFAMGTRVLTVDRTVSYKIRSNFDVCFRHPSSQWPNHDEDQNDHSLVVDINFYGHRIMLGGDLSSKGWEAVYGNSFPREIDFLKVPHHGSGTGIPLQWLQNRKISHAVISCAQKNRYSHPHCPPLKKYFNNGSVYLTCLTRGDGVQYQANKCSSSVGIPVRNKKGFDCRLLECFSSSCGCSGA